MARRLSEMLAECEAQGRSEARAADVLIVLRERFGRIPRSPADRLLCERDVGVLADWPVLALRTTSPSAFARTTVR